MEFKQIVTPKIYKLVIDQIKQMIFDKKLCKGDKLPSERDLSSQLGVSRTAVREALRSLEMVGLIDSYHGKGTFVADSFPEDKLFEPLSLLYMLEDNTDELSEVRSMLEIQCAGLAATKIEPTEMQELLKCINAFKQRPEGPELADVDNHFHEVIAKASHNKLLYYLHLSIHEVIKHHITNMRYLIITDPHNSQLLLAQHMAVYEAIMSGNIGRARQEMDQHMEFVRNQFHSRFAPVNSNEQP